MANLNPLSWNHPIVDAKGLPTKEFQIKWGQLARAAGSIPVLNPPGNPAMYLRGTDPIEWGQVKDSDLSLSDILTNDVSVDMHGFAPKLPDDPTLYLDGEGNWTEPAGGGGGTGGDPFQFPPAYDPSQNSAAHGSNVFVGRLFRPLVNMTLNAVNMRLNAFTGSAAYAVCYQAAAGGVLTGGTLLGQSTSGAPTTGAVNTFTFNTPISLTAGTVYWIGCIWTGAGTVTPAIAPTIPMRFFGHSTATAPDPAPASTSTVANYFPAWIT